MIDFVKNYSITSRRIKGSAIRELLKLTQNPEIISFAGGLPSPDSFPVEAIADISQQVLKENPKAALQYSPTEGIQELREEIVKLMRRKNFNVSVENVMVTASSQQALDLVGRVFIDPTDPILVELPTYIGGLQAFSAYGARFVGVNSDDYGMIVSDLHRKLKVLRDSDEHYKFAYIVPDFQNPSGVTWTTERRQELLRLAKGYSLIVVDDSPYRELRFEGEKPPALHNLDDSHSVITLRTFSKIFAPGLRLGWIVAPEEVIGKLSIAKQSMDLCTSSFSQYIAAEFLRRDLLDSHIDKIKDLYRVKRDAMHAALEKYMPVEAGVRWVKPQGGLFLWVTLPVEVDTDEMFPEAVERKVAYVIGSAFHCDGTGQNTMRLNFSYPTVEQIDEGIKRLADCIKNRLTSKAKAAV
ncbi:MAG: PLP-dependent aminotransferase family protein [Elusimicrobiota bacterium]